MECKTEWNVTPEGMPVKVNVMGKHQEVLAFAVLTLDGNNRLSMLSEDRMAGKPAAPPTAEAAAAPGEAGV